MKVRFHASDMEEVFAVNPSLRDTSQWIGDDYFAVSYPSFEQADHELDRLSPLRVEFLVLEF